MSGFRRDLRISDHEPLYRAAMRGLVVPIFVPDRALLHHSKTALVRVGFMLGYLKSRLGLGAVRGQLILRYGDSMTILPALIRETEADGIYAHTDVERIHGRVRDARLNRVLTVSGHENSLV